MFTVTFQIPASLATQTPIAYLVSISGATSTNVPFSSVNSASLTINPAAQILVAPTSGQQGQSLSVAISGQYTNFLQGATKANFGPGVSVGGSAAGQFGPVTVTSATSANAQLQIDPSAAAGPNTATVATGAQQATTTFTINTGAPAVNVAPSLIFSNQQIGTSSVAQPDTFTNTGTQPLSITNIAKSGANPTEFIQTNDCPIFPSTLAAGAHCTFQVSFAPLAVGTRTASIVITDNAGNVPGTMQSISLSGTGVAPPPQTITVPLTFNPGTNVSQTATLFCPSGTTPCTDANAHSMKVTVSSVTAPFTLTVTAFEVSTTEANGICENGQTETTDFDCRFQTYFAFQTLPNGDIVTPLCIPYSNGNCVFYRIGNIPPTSSFQGPVWEYIAWNNTALVPPQNYQANNPRLYDDPDAPPYDINHQFVFDITDYFNANANKVGVDPGIAGHTIQFNDFVVAWPPILFSPNIAFGFLSPASGASVSQGTQLPVSFSLSQNGVNITNAVTAPNAVSMGVVDSNGVRMPTLAPNGSPAAFLYDPTLNAYTLTLATQSYPPGTYTLFVNSDLFPQQSTTFTVTAAAATSITATGGGAQNVQVNTAFGSQLSVTVLDASGSPVSGVSVTFTAPSSGPSGTFAGGFNTVTVTTNASGVATSPVFTANAIAGSYTVTANVAGVSTPANFLLTNTAGAATHFAVSAPAAATAGTAFNFVVTALDAANNTATTYAGTVHFSSSDAQALLPANTTLINGTGTFTATLKTAGTQAITATDTVNSSITGTSNTITVSSGGATHFAVSAPTSATAGTAFSFTVMALDAGNNTVTGYTGTVHFTSTDAAAALPADYTFTTGDAGTHTFSATLKTVGTQSLTATDRTTATISGTATGIVVNSAPLVSITVTPANPSATVGNTIPEAATGLYSDQSTKDLTGSVTWTATDVSPLPLNSYKQTNLVSDTQGLAPVVDPKLVNPWGLTYLPGGPFWVANNGSGFATVYNQTGAIQVSYAIPATNGISNPTGIAANAGGGFSINGTSSQFIFVTEGGTILGWNGGAAAVLAVDNSASGAVYKGLALIQNGASQFLLATNFSAGTVDIFDSTFKPATFTGNFTDPNLPPGYAPFGIEVINGQVVVTYALQDATKKQAVHQAGAGYVDLFDANGNLVRRIASQGNLNAPWAVTLSPASFGAFGGDLLVGNFGDGTINAYNFTTGAFVGQMQDENGAVLVNLSLWALRWGGGGAAGDPNTLYMTAGLGHGKHGVFAAISPNPSVASINAAGTATALSTGTSTLAATLGNISGSTTLTVTPAQLLAITVLPTNPSVAAGSTEQSEALGTFSDSSTEILSTGVTWASSIPATAGVDSTGLASALKAGTTSISATVGGVTGSTTLTVTPAPTTTTTAVSATATFSTSNQFVPMSATVTSLTGTVNAGTVTFTVLQGNTQVGLPVTGSVTGGASSATFVLPGNTPTGTYTITATYNPAGGFIGSSDNTHTLTVNPAGTTTTSANASALFSESNQNVSLSATVTSAAGAVNVGTVTFTVTQGATTIGAPVSSGTVNNGAASATFVLPAGTPAGTYTITATFNAAGGFAGSSDNTHSLSITTAATITTAANASATFSTSNQNVTLTATVTSGAGTVNVGTVAFMVTQAGTTIGTPVTSGTVTGGAASATFVLPGNTVAGTYTITAVYNAAGGFTTSSDATHTLTVGVGATTTTAANAAATFSASNQNVTLTATVTSGAGTVNAGTVTFTVTQGGTTIGTPVTSGTVTSGAANATFVLPANTAVGAYTITASYNGAGGFASSSDNTHALTVSAAATTTTGANASATFSENNQNVILSATVASAAGTVNAGTVTFTVTQGGTTIGAPVTSGTVTGGAANATFVLPANTAVGAYTITASYNGAGGLASSSDNTHALTITGAGTITTAANASATFSASNQNVALTATVTSGAGSVNVGTVTFTVTQAGTTIGTPVTSGTVTGGAASATFVLPGNTVAGTYTITAVYNAAGGFTTSSDATHTLTVGVGATTTTAANAAATFSASNQNVTLTATVTSGAGTVNAGTVTFTVTQGGTTIGTPVTSGTVTSGAANATFVLPANTAVGAYTITASYNGAGGFASSSDNTHALTVSAAATTTTGANASATFSESNQNVILSATVTSASGTVNVGTVTFTVTQGGATIGTPVTSGTVSGGLASAAFVLPANTAVGSYSITATYNGTGNFAGSSDNTHALTVTSAATTTTAANASATFSASNQNVTLTATVTSGAGPVNAGTVTFTVTQAGTTIGSPVTSGTVTGGAASATFVLPGNTVAGTYTITAVYNAAGGFTTSSDATHTLTVVIGSPTITTAALPNGQVGSSYFVQLTAAGGTAPYTWSITQGVLPQGLSLNPSNGQISGLPQQAVPSTTVTVQVTDSSSPTGQTATRTYTFTIIPATLTITTTSLPDGQINVAYSANLTAAGGTPQYTWAVTNGALPSGVTLNTSTGVISGTPSVSATFTVTFTVNDSGSPIQTASASFTFTIVGPPVITQAIPASVHQGDVNQNVTLVGQFTHFVQGQTTVVFQSSAVNVNSVTVNSSTSVTVNLSINATATIGLYSVTVTTGTEVATGTNILNVLHGIPVVTLSPNFGVQGTSPTITITGTFTTFTQGQTTANFGADIPAGAVTVNSPTQATVQLQISVTATLGQRPIFINTGTESAQGAFTVTAGVPVIVAVSPNVGGQNVTGLSVVVNANFTNWANGTTVASFGAGISVGGGPVGGLGPVTVNGAGQFTASITIAAGATLGPRDITVKTGAEQEVAGGAFTVENCTTTAAAVLYTSPVYNASGVPLNTEVQVEFNAPLDRASINTTSVFLQDSVTGVRIPITVNLDAAGRTVTIQPTQLLAVGRTFYVYIGNSATVTDACGNALNTFTLFTTTFTPETSGPSVLQTSPVNNDTNVPLNTQIVLQFSVPVDPITLQNGFTVTTGGNPVPGTFTTMFNNSDYTRVVFTPGTNLTPSTLYTVTYTAQLTDDVGNPLVNPGSFSFTAGTATDTTGGTVIATDPQYNETNIGTNVSPVFHLSKIVDPISVDTSTVYIFDYNTSKFLAATVTVSADRRTVTLTPSAPLQPGTFYAAAFGGGHGSFDLAGNIFFGYTFYFTTAGSAITAGPVVTQISPSDGTAGAPVNTQVVAVMSGLIDPNTVGNNAITVTPAGGTTPLAATVTLAADQVTLTWVPGSNLSTSTQYNVTVAGFADTQGNAAAPFSSSFTTSSNGTPVGAGSLTALSVTPANGAVNVSNTAQVVITFSETVDPATVNNILVRDGSNGYYNLAGIWAVNPTNGAQVTFTPAQPYPANAFIQVWTQDAVRDLAGNTDTAYVVTTFTVSSTAIDTTAPTVTSVTPTNNATGIGRNAALVLTFSKSVNPATVNANTIGVFQGDSLIGVGYTMSANNRTVIITATWPPATTISVVATAKVQDFSGNSLVPSESQFTTAADFSTAHPGVVTQRPASGAINVPPNAVITLFTNGKPLNASTVTPNSLHVSHNGVLIDGTINITGNNQAIEFVPSQNFNYGDIVQIFLDSTVQDVDGNALFAYQGSFTIHANPGTTMPTVLNTNPLNGVGGVPANPVVQVEFDEAMASSTINSATVLLCPNNNCSAPVAGTVSLIGANNNIVQFVPSSPLLSNTYYYLNLINVTNAQGLALANSYYVYFLTGAATDTIRPTIVAVSPLNGTSNVGLNAFVLVEFSKAIDPVSVMGSTIHISGGGQTVVPVTVGFGRFAVPPPFVDYVVITPQAPLPANTVMTVAINGVTDIAGNLVVAQTTQFTTGAGPDITPANVIFVNPDNGATNVATNAVIVVQYDKQMDTSTICDNPCGSTFLYDSVTGQHIAGTLMFSTDLMSFTFVPNASLLVGRTYYIYAYGALDLTGNVQNSSFNQFTTGFAASATIPAVVNTNPENLLTGVATNTKIQVLFNEPIRPESIVNVTLLQGGTPVSVVPSLSQGDRLVTLTPNALLLAGTPYTISITGVQDFAGHTQSGTFTSTFTTGAAFDVAGGNVTSTDPVYGQTNVGTNTLIRVFFSKRINPISLQLAIPTVYTYDTGRYLPVALVSIAPDRLSATFDPPLQANTNYYFNLPGISDVAGNSVSGVTIFFTTGTEAITSGPSVSSISPSNGTAGTPVNTQVMVVMSAAVDPNTIGNTSITVTPNGSTTPVPATVTLAADLVTLTWVPSVNLATSAVYNVSVSGFVDSEGNPAIPFTSSFTTGSNGTPVGAGLLTALSVTPANNAVNVSNSAQVTITFSEAIDPLTVNNILVRDASIGYYNLSGTWVVSPSNVATFTPAQPYPANATIQVWTQDAVRDLAGNTDTAYVVTTFTVGGTLDTTTPTVTSVTPTDGTTNVGRDIKVMLTFSKSINPATVTGSTIQLLAGDAVTNPGATISANNRTITLNTSNLAPSTTYTVVATSQLQDFSGNALQYFQSQFTTGPFLSPTGPAVVTQRPAIGATDVPANTVITLFTNGAPLNPSTVTSSSLRVAQNGVLVSGTISLPGDGHTIVFTPSSNFNFGALVQIYMDQTVTDINSVPLTSVYGGSFTIAGNPASVVPQVLGTNPPNGIGSVPTNPVVEVEFDQALAASTVNSTNVLLCPNNNCTTPASGKVSLTGANNNVVQFAVSASTPLTSNTYYYLNLVNVTNAQGLALTNSYYVYFLTATAINSTVPSVRSVGPPNNATGVGVNASIILTFNNAIDPLSINASTVQVTGGSQTVVPSTINFGRYFVANPYFDYVSITPQAPLPVNTLMTITINGVTDQQGNPVTPQTTTFTTGPGPDLTAPTVVFISWQYNDVVATNASFSEEFDRPMDPGTINTQTFLIYDATAASYLTSAETVSVSADLKTETITLQAGTLVSGHTIYIYSQNAQDLAGNVEPQNFSIAVVGPTADTTPPVVLETNPPANFAGVPLNAPIQIEFSKEIAQDSIGSVQLLQGGSAPVAVTASFSRLSTVLTLTPNVPLLPNTSYTISIAGVTDTAGNVFSGTQTVGFTTGSAVKLAQPVNVSVTETATINIAFDSPMDPLGFDTVLGNVVLELSSTSAVIPTTVSFTLDYKTAMLTPSSPLVSGTSYTVVVKYATVTDIAGNVYANSISTSFTAP